MSSDEEVTPVERKTRGGSSKDSKVEHAAWKTAAAILGVLIGAGTVAGVIGKAFYVTRAEYTEKVTADAIGNTTVKETLNRLNDTLREQKGSFDQFSTQVETVKTDVAIIKNRQASRR